MWTIFASINIFQTLKRGCTWAFKNIMGFNEVKVKTIAYIDWKMSSSP